MLETKKPVWRHHNKATRPSVRDKRGNKTDFLVSKSDQLIVTLVYKHTKIVTLVYKQQQIPRCDVGSVFFVFVFLDRRKKRRKKSCLPANLYIVLSSFFFSFLIFHLLFLPPPAPVHPHFPPISNCFRHLLISMHGMYLSVFTLSQKHFWTDKSVQMSKQRVRVCVCVCVCVCVNYVNY